jgi:hypothetical protein
MSLGLPSQKQLPSMLLAADNSTVTLRSKFDQGMGGTNAISTKAFLTALTPNMQSQTTMN